MTRDAFENWSASVEATHLRFEPVPIARFSSAELHAVGWLWENNAMFVRGVTRSDMVKDYGESW